LLLKLFILIKWSWFPLNCLMLNILMILPPNFVESNLWLFGFIVKKSSFILILFYSMFSTGLKFEFRLLGLDFRVKEEDLGLLSWCLRVVGYTCHFELLIMKLFLSLLKQWQKLLWLKIFLFLSLIHELTL